MGRKKIKIARINDDRNRSVTYLKRKAGLMKKAHELAVLTGSEVAVIVFGQNGRLTEFCSGDMDRVLLRYTEHSGPVERKGPEHYSNDDEDSEDDNDGDDGDGAEGASGGGGAAGIGGGGPPDQFPPDNGRNGGSSGKDQGRDSKSNKRKAAGGHRMTDANSISMSSEGSSKRGSPPSSSAPIIKVEGDVELGPDEGGVNKGALKAAIIQRSISRPSDDNRKMNGSRSTSALTHHHSYSGGDADALQHHNSNVLISAPVDGNIHLQAMSNRPYTAGAMMGMQVDSSSMPSSQPQHSSHSQNGSPPRFAYSVGETNLNPNLNHSSSMYLRPQGWSDSGVTPLVRVNSNTSATSQDVSYGDLAAGGSTSPAASPYKMHQTIQSISPLPSPHTLNAAQNYATLQSTYQHPQGNHSSLLPLAHPILRQHPQYESYANQLRIQQQQFQGSRNPSQPSFSVHTAPSSPNHLTFSGNQTMRSASFGYEAGHASRREFQQSLNHDPMQFADGEKIKLSHQQNFFSNGINDFGGTLMPPPPYASQQQQQQQRQQQRQQQQQESETSISNAAFNDLMGSILSDIGSSTSGGSVGGSGDERSKEQEDVIRSMESDGSLSTLVNSESFDALTNHNNKKEVIKVDAASPGRDVASRLALEARDSSNVS